MVGGGRSALDATDIRRLKLGFVGLVGVSGTMMGVQAGGGLELIALTTLVGVLAGIALLWYLTWVAAT